MLKIVCLILSCWLILPGPVMGQHSLKIDSLERIVAESGTDSLKYDALVDLHNLTFRENPEASKQYALAIIQLGNVSGKLLYTYKGYLALNRYETKFRNYDKIIPNSKMLLSIAKKLNQPDEIFDRTLGLAYNYIDGEKNDLVVPQLNEAMKVARANKNALQEHKVNYAFGFFYHNTGQSARSLQYLEKAIAEFKKSGDDKSLANAIGLYAESSLANKPEPKTLNLLIVAEKLHEKNNSRYRQAYIRSLMGKYFALSGNSVMAIENFEFARKMFKDDNNTVDYALAGLDQSVELLLQKKYRQAASLINESETIIKEKNYTQGKPLVDVAWAEYYLSTNQIANAKKQLKQLNELPGSEKALDIKLKYLQLQALVAQKSGNLPAQHKAFFDYYKSLFTQNEQATVQSALNLFNRRYAGADSNLRHILSIVNTPDGYRKLKNYFNKVVYDGAVLPDSMLKGIAGLPVDSLLDDTLGLSYDMQLESVDAVINKKLLLESLAKQKQANEKNIIMGFIIAALLLIVIVILVLYLRQIKQKKKKTEQDKKTIENLHIQLNHLVVNNLKSVGDFIDRAKEEKDLNQAIDSLKVRVDVVRNFYEIYKRQKISDQLDAGKGVVLQQYFEELAAYLKLVYNFEDSYLRIFVDAEIMVSYNKGINLVLLISELIQNTCKYAFNDHDVDRENEIYINVTIDDQDVLHLLYRDNGPGKPEETQSGLGSEIIKEITETLQAITNSYNSKGYHYALQVKLKRNEYKKTKS